MCAYYAVMFIFLLRCKKITLKTWKWATEMLLHENELAMENEDPSSIPAIQKMGEHHLPQAVPWTPHRYHVRHVYTNKLNVIKRI